MAVIELTRAADAVAPQAVTTAEPWELDAEVGRLTVDDLLDMTPDDLLAWASDPSITYEQQVAMLAVLNDPAVSEYARFRKYREDPVGFVFEVIQGFIWSAQRRILESVRDNRYTSVPSAHGVGKSHVAACCVAWWVSCHAPGDALVITTAPTASQVRTVLWRYINTLHSQGALPGRTNLSQWYIGTELVGIGRKPADTNPGAFQGSHAPYLLVVIDEADRVHADIYGALQTLTTTETARILAIGNPDLSAGRFFDANLPGSGWNMIRIPAWDTPNFEGHPKRIVPPESPPVPIVVRKNLVDATFVEDIATDPHYGVDSNYFRSKVDAIAPEDSPMAVMPLTKLRECMLFEDKADRLIQWDPDSFELTMGQDLGPVEVGLDVGAGGDMTVARERRGMVLGRVRRLNDEDTMKQIPKIVAFLRLVGAEVVKVDVIGIGKGVYDRLKQLKREGAIDCRVVGVNVGRAGRKANSRRPGFPKLRDQIWWEVGRGNTMTAAWDLSVLWDEQWILPELYQPTYEELLNGDTKVTSKDDMRKLLGHSPDDADSILLAFLKTQTQAGGDPSLLSTPIG